MQEVAQPRTCQAQRWLLLTWAAGSKNEEMVSVKFAGGGRPGIPGPLLMLAKTQLLRPRQRLSVGVARAGKQGGGPRSVPRLWGGTIGGLGASQAAPRIISLKQGGRRRTLAT
jgi:hypothetical protein